MMSFAQWGNALYSGKKSYPLIERRAWWLSIGVGLILISIVLIGVRGLNPSIDFEGGSQFSMTNVTTTEQQPAYDVFAKHDITSGVRVSALGTSGLRVQTEQVDPSLTREIAEELGEAYGVTAEDVDATNIGPSWGGEVTRKAMISLVTFLILVGALMAVYFRSWTMSVTALFALFHDIFLTAGFFALTQVEVSPATVIGFLTILAYSLYDTVVVFDRVRELTTSVTAQTRYTFAELVNLAVNQTLVRSINTSVVALLPVGAILFLGSLLLGAGTLTDISLALFVGILVGTMSSIFIASAALVFIEQRRGRVKAHTARVMTLRAGKSIPNEDGDEEVASNLASTPMTARAVTPGYHRGQSYQPHRKNRKNKR